MTQAFDDDATREQRRALRRHRMAATGLLVAAGAVYTGATLSGLQGFGIALLRAGSEAALVGGLADWFAVTALFRRPLGLPIPHTAVIPRNKERIGVGLGRFIELNFLEPKLVADRLRSAGVSRRLGEWLAHPANALAVADRLVTIGAFVFRSLNDRDLQDRLQAMIRRQLLELDPAPAAAALVAALRQNGGHQELFDQMVAALRDYVVANRERILGIVATRTAWWVPGRVDRQVGKAIADGLVGYLDELQDRDHEARASFDAAVDRLAHDLRHSPAHRERLARLRDQVVGAPQVRDYLERLWRQLRAAAEADLRRPESGVRGALAELLGAVGAALAADPAVQARMDRRIEAVVVELVTPWRAEIGRFVADVVRGWETRTIVDRVELAVGRDLQYIRVNGTLVGAFVGCVIFLLTHALG